MHRLRSPWHPLQAVWEDASVSRALITLLGLLLIVSQAEAAGGHSMLVQTRVPPMSVRLVQTPRALPAEEIWIKAFVNGARLQERVTGRASEEFSGQGVIVSVRMPSRAPALVRIASVRRTGARVRVTFWWKA